MSAETNLLVGAALQEAVRQVRAAVHDETAGVVVVTPSAVNGLLAMRELGRAGGFIRVEFGTPTALQARLAAPGLREQGFSPEPLGWLGFVLADALAETELPGGYGEVLSAPGWYLGSRSR